MAITAAPDSIAHPRPSSERTDDLTVIPGGRGIPERVEIRTTDALAPCFEGIALADEAIAAVDQRRPRQQVGVRGPARGEPPARHRQRLPGRAPPDGRRDRREVGVTIHVRPAVLLAASPKLWLARFVLPPPVEKPRRHPVYIGNRRRRADRVIRPSERAAA